MWTPQQQRQMGISIDCIKSCPYQPHLVAMAYYQTDPTTKGAISITHISQAQHIHQVQCVQCPPLLHLAWGKSISQPQKYILAAASRTNDIIMFSYNPIQKTLLQEKVINIGSNIFCLYLDLITYPHCYIIVVSTNQSAVFNLQLDAQFNILSKQTHKKHEYAVWTCRLNPFQKDTFACGDQVNSIYLYHQNSLTSRNNTSHKEGICDLVFTGEYEMYSGGFDGIVCSFDTRMFKEHVSRHEWGGTIWRVVPDQSSQHFILCNSSEKKFQVVDKENKQLWNSGESHASLAYAADWQGSDIVAASFYDKKLCYYSANK